MPLSLADEEPHLKKLVAACQKLGLKYQPEPNKSFPRYWWKNSGRILVEIDKVNKTPKEELMKSIAQRAKAFKIKKKVSPPPKETKTHEESDAVTKYKTKKNVSAKRKKQQMKKGSNQTSNEKVKS